MIGADEERELILKAQAGDRAAAAELLAAHEGFWRKLARRPTEDPEDTMQEILLAAFECIFDFDTSRGLRFLTYAKRKVMWRLTMLRENAGLVRCPQRCNYVKLNPELQHKARQARKTVSLNAPAASGFPRSTLFADDFDLADEIDRRESIARVKRALRQLDARSARVLRLRFDDVTLEEIGRMYGVTKERVRQIETKALDRLQSLLSRKNVV